MLYTVTAVLSLIPVMALGGGFHISDPYARATSPAAKSAAAFFVIHNETDTAVTITSASTDVARNTQMHTHLMEDGIAKMRHLENGITVEPGRSRALRRGGDHVMLMGLLNGLKDGDVFRLVLEIDGGETIEIDVPVDNQRKPRKESSTDGNTHN